MVIDLTRGRVKFHEKSFEMVGLTHRNPKHNVGPLRDFRQPQTYPFFRVEIDYVTKSTNRRFTTRACDACKGRMPQVRSCSVCGRTGKTSVMNIRLLLYQPNSYKGKTWVWRDGWREAKLRPRVQQWLCEFCQEFVGKILDQK